MCGQLDSWRGAVVGIDRIVVVLEGEEREEENKVTKALKKEKRNCPKRLTVD